MSGKASKGKSGIKQPEPLHRRIRAFAYDPSLSRKVETVKTNQITIELGWEDNLDEGPVDDYIQVVDYDPASGLYYFPVDLNDPNLLAQDGLSPSEANPQFHQQMVYAVTRRTIDHFEKALGRCALWSSRKSKNGELIGDTPKQLRVYPHAIRDANAYYSPTKKAILYGYFPASISDPGDLMPGGTVFTCLSHDIIAHETAHALLDGLHPRFIEPSNIDAWALHEAFADIIALFQHFTYPEVLEHQISVTRGDLEKQNLLGKLAIQMGHATGKYGALRDAIGEINKETNEWRPLPPDPEKIHNVKEPHQRGAILVAAVFDAFLTIYRWRAKDLLRIATGGTGILPQGDIHPDLVKRLANEASKTASHILQMCIRALDYCPPVDVDFGDYLRALITADYELVREDKLSYRTAFIDAFRERGIFPLNISSLAEENLIWPTLDDEQQKPFEPILGNKKVLDRIVPDWSHHTDREKALKNAKNSREELWKIMREEYLEAAKAAGIEFEDMDNKGVSRDKEKIPMLEVHSVRPCRRIGPDGQTVTELIIEMTQQRVGFINRKTQELVDKKGLDKLDEKDKSPDFIFRGGTTLIIDLIEKRVKYCITKGLFDEERFERVRSFLETRYGPSLMTLYAGDPRIQCYRDLMALDGDRPPIIEPFAFLHQVDFEEEDYL